ncbi:MAG: ComEA family DNA-binding protein [Solobacterium sp.]|nr:ComEA family DNA-binding protein [Solobacterium sp.]
MKQMLIFCFLLIVSFGTDMHQKKISDLQKDTISVTVEGAVENAGTIQLEHYSTVQDVIDRAGLSENADISSINPLYPVNDRDILIIPEKKTDEELPRISINTGDIEALTLLPGIGDATAERIILYRESNGSFQIPEDLMNVKGIGPAKFEKLKDLICL